MAQGQGLHGQGHSVEMLEEQIQQTAALSELQLSAEDLLLSDELAEMAVAVCDLCAVSTGWCSQLGSSLPLCSVSHGHLLMSDSPVRLDIRLRR